MLAARDQRYSYCQRPPSMACGSPRSTSRVRTLEIDGGLLHPHVGLAPEELQVRAFRAGLPGAHQIAHLLVRDEAHDLRLDVGLGETLPPARVARSPRRRLRASASTSASSPAMRACGAEPPRSCASVVMAIVQPSFSRPTMFSRGTRTSSKNTSLNQATPVISTSGRIVMPGLFMSTSRKREAPVLGRLEVGPHDQDAPVGEAGVAGPDLLARDVEDVAVELGAGAASRQVGAGVRLGESLAPDVVAGEDAAAGSGASAPRCRDGSASGRPDRGRRRCRSSAARRRACTPRRRGTARAASRRGRRTRAASGGPPSRPRELPLPAIVRMPPSPSGSSGLR